MSDVRPTEERLWRVRVARYTNYPAKPTSKPSLEILQFIVSALDSDEALARGRAHCETTTPLGMVLRGVEALEAATIQLPYRL